MVRHARRSPERPSDRARTPILMCGAHPRLPSTAVSKLAGDATGHNGGPLPEAARNGGLRAG